MQTAAALRKAAHAPVRAPSRTNVRFAVIYAVLSDNEKPKSKNNPNATAAAPPTRPQGVSRRRRRRTP